MNISSNILNDVQERRILSKKNKNDVLISRDDFSSVARVILMFSGMMTEQRFSYSSTKKEGLFMFRFFRNDYPRSVVNEVLLRIVRMILNLRFFCPQTVSFLSALYQSWQHISVIWEKD